MHGSTDQNEIQRDKNPTECLTEDWIQTLFCLLTETPCKISNHRVGKVFTGWGSLIRNAWKPGCFEFFFFFFSLILEYLQNICRLSIPKLKTWNPKFSVSTCVACLHSKRFRFWSITSFRVRIFGLGMLHVYVKEYAIKCHNA